MLKKNQDEKKNMSNQHLIKYITQGAILNQMKNAIR